MTVFLARQARLECPAAPAPPGFRGAESGLFRYVGRGGSIWSSSISDANAYYLNFLGDGAIVPKYLRFRAIGLPLRCLQE